MSNILSVRVKPFEGWQELVFTVRRIHERNG
jgi:hypothetical protein